MNRRAARTLDAALAVTSDGHVLVNANQLVREKMDVATMIAAAKASGLPVFVGVVLPPNHRGGFVRELDDAAADIAGRLGYRLIAALRGSASGPSSAARASSRRDRPWGPARHRRDR